MWAGASREGMKSTCFKEIKQNITLQESKNDNNESIVASIKSVTCPNECNGNGICENGKIFVYEQTSL